MIKAFFGKSYEPLNRVLVSKGALLHNLNLYRHLNPGLAICPVLKSNAYGHGLVEVAKILDKEACAYFVVDSLYEAYELKKNKVKTKILILGYQNPENLRPGLPFVFTAYDFDSLEVLVQKNLSFHLEIDTGMKRMGFDPAELKEALPLLSQKPHLLQGVFSHLMTADSIDTTRLDGQCERFKAVLKKLAEAGLHPKWVHLGNSAGSQKIALPEATMARIGLGLYGVNPYEKEDPHFKDLAALQPVLRIESTLIAVRDLQPGDAISYGAQFIASEAMTIGIIPFGYYEGLPIALSKKGFVSFKNTPCKIVGRINMNHTFIDLTGLSAKVGDIIEVYSDQKDRKNFVGALARSMETIPYELLVRLSPTIRRVVS